MHYFIAVSPSLPCKDNQESEEIVYERSVEHRTYRVESIGSDTLLPRSVGQDNSEMDIKGRQWTGYTCLNTMSSSWLTILKPYKREIY